MASYLPTPRWLADACNMGTTLGDPELRELLLARTFGSAETAGIRPDVEQVVVTSGSNQLLHLVAESLLDPGDIVLCASPTYLVFLGTLANLGARSVGVKSDELGMIPDGLEEQLQTLQRMGESDRVKAIYLVNYFDNPRGITMPAERISQVIAIAQRWSHTHRIHVIADEAYRELRYQGDDEASALLLDEEGGDGHRCRDVFQVLLARDKSGMGDFAPPLGQAGMRPKRKH